METTTLTFALTWQRCLRLFKYTRIFSFSPKIAKLLLNLKEDFVLTLHCDGASQLYPPKGKPFGCLPDQVISFFNLYIHCNEKSVFLSFQLFPSFLFLFLLIFDSHYFFETSFRFVSHLIMDGETSWRPGSSAQMAEISIAQLPCDNSSIFPVDVIFPNKKVQGPVMDTSLVCSDCDFFVNYAHEFKLLDLTIPKFKNGAFCCLPSGFNKSEHKNLWCKVHKCVQIRHFQLSR